jgi:hypothetical protein
MPVTAKLSRKFYDALGDDVANELVEWFNAVDLTYRSELRELNELNYARFEAKLGEGIATLRADFDTKLAAFRADFETRIGALRSELKQDIAEARAAAKQDLADTRADLIKWMFLFWLGSVAASVASRFF